jgi:hypothetical protein
MKEFEMAEAKGLSKPVKLKKDLAELLEATLPIFKNTKSKSKSGKVTDLTNLKKGQTIDMMQMAAVVGANIE